VRLCRIKEKCLETDLKWVNGWSSSTVQWKRVPKFWSSNRETTSSGVHVVRRNWQTRILGHFRDRGVTAASARRRCGFASNQLIILSVGRDVDFRVSVLPQWRLSLFGPAQLVPSEKHWKISCWNFFHCVFAKPSLVV